MHYLAVCLLKLAAALQKVVHYQQAKMIRLHLLLLFSHPQELILGIIAEVL